MVFAMSGHIPSFSRWERVRKRSPRRAKRMLGLSVLTPLPTLVQALNEFQPAALSGYSTVLTLLAEEQRAGRLRIKPAMVLTGAESLSAASHARIEEAFHCLVRDAYGASEFQGIALECEQGWLHVNADWALLEPVDEAYQPVAAGQPSFTVLLTNLANRVQPVIRYDLGDSILVRPDPCPAVIRSQPFMLKDDEMNCCGYKPHQEPGFRCCLWPLAQSSRKRQGCEGFRCSRRGQRHSRYAWRR